MSRIEAIRVRQVSIPLRKAFRISKASLLHQEVTVVEVETSSGVGLGEAQFVPGFFSCHEGPDTTHHAIASVLAPRVVGRDATDFRTVAHEIDRILPGQFYAKAALIDAVVDAAARSYGAPLSKLFGGGSTELRLAWPIGIASPEEMVAEGRLARAGGVTELKVKIGGRRREDDLEAVTAIKESLGDGIAVKVDGNAGLQLEDAVWLLPRLSELGVQLIEEPLRAPAPWKWARLRALVPDILMADESVTSCREAFELWRGGFIDAVAIKLAKMGGLVASADLVMALQRVGLRVVGASHPASSIGVANMAHMMSGLGGFSFAGEFHAGASQLFATDIVTQPLDIRGGLLRVDAHCVGNGMTLDESTVREIQTHDTRHITARNAG